jgi:hypothetical protein
MKALARKAAGNEPALPFLQLDYVYTPSRDVAADVSFFTGELGGRLAFAIEAMGMRVAMIELSYGPPHIVLADHIEGDRPILVYRVASVAAAKSALKAQGFKPGTALEIPMGPCLSFTSSGGHRIAVYELTRPMVAEHFTGRRDF